ncbi:MAG TPA: hypothetical protein VN842_02860 [Thermoplasmata archaeon]|nr:hypothetical protein [Thermoplasmata archaeon]
MSSRASVLATKDQPLPADADRDLAELFDAPRGRVRRVGSVRLPLGGPYRPKAVAYRLPDGRIVWCVRLWEVDRAVRRCVSSATIRQFCRMNRLPGVEGEVDRVEGR